MALSVYGLRMKDVQYSKCNETTISNAEVMELVSVFARACVCAHVYKNEHDNAIY